MDELLIRRRVLKAKLTRVNTAIQNKDKPLDSEATRVQLEILEAIVQDLRELERETLLECSPPEFDKNEKELAEMMQKYAELRASLLRLSKALNQQENQAQNVPAPAVQPAAPAVKLPRLELPTFSGCLTDWPTFHDRFCAAVHNRPDLPGSTKLQYLMSSLSGDPADLLQAIPMADANYAEAWQMLVNRYKNNREIALAHLKRLHEQPAVPACSSAPLRKLVDTTNECMRCLRVLGVPVDGWDLEIFYVLSTKIDGELKKQWELTYKDDSYPKLTDFLEFLDRQAKANAVTEMTNPTPSKPKLAQNSTKQVVSAPRTHCHYCNANDHRVHQCSQFLKMSVAERRTWVQSKALCLNCLRSGHSPSECLSQRSCWRCSAKHHTLLHVDSERGSYHAHTTPQSGSTTNCLLATAVVKVEDGRKQMSMARTLLDSGSQVNIVTEDCVQRLGLKRRYPNESVEGIGGQGATKGVVDLIIQSTSDPLFRVSLTAIVMSRITGNQPNFPLDPKPWTHLNALRLADPNFYRPDSVDILLGGELFYEVLREGSLDGPDGAPKAKCTALGWIVSGAVKTSSNVAPAPQSFHACCQLEELVQRFWALEQVPDKRLLSQEEQKCEEHYRVTFSRTHDGRYVVRLPFKENGIPLGDSRTVALRRLYQLEKRLAACPENLTRYNTVLQEYLDLDHMEKVPATELKKEPSAVFYHPHHAVIKESSSTTKVRVVFDASAKTPSGSSLNSNLLVGPVIQDDLFSILLRVRKHQIMFSADVEKMYRQVLVHPEDQDYQRILWRRTPGGPIEEYRLKTVTFGVASAPFQAIRTLHQIADDNHKEFPLAASVIKSDFYVDDLISGANSVEEALNLQQQLITILARGGFPLRKWSSSHQAVLEALPEDMREMQLPLDLDSTKTYKALGVQWHPTTDCFIFKLIPPDVDQKITKRIILSDLSKVFDPLGLLSPITVRAKIIFQALWNRQVDWDDEVPIESKNAWTAYVSDLSAIPSIKIIRCACIPNAITLQLHGFSDASELAYGAAVYLKSTNSDGDSLVSLLAAKTRVAPRRTKSLPRLELEAAVLLARLMKTTKTALQTEFQALHAYTDSSIVLTWVTNLPEKWLTYVGNRVALIQETLPSTVWHHVPGAENPADVASRGISSEDLAAHPLWWTGPAWIKEGCFPPFPGELNLDSRELMERPLFSGVISNPADLFDRFSSYFCLIRTVALCERYVLNVKEKVKFTKLNPDRKTEFKRILKVGPLTTKELKAAETTCLKIVQIQHFSLILAELAKPEAQLKGDLAKLNPWIDQDGLLRVGGRLNNSNLKFDRKHPILLPKKSSFTTLLIRYEHFRHLHCGTLMLHSVLQRRFWIIGARNAIQKVTRMCVRCFRFRADSAKQLMAALPKIRVNPVRPFLDVGLDYAGPVLLKSIYGSAKKQFKGYIALFICFATKAVRLELVSDLTTAKCILAIKRFCSNHGKPRKIITDCGRNFTGARKELRHFLESAEHNEAITRSLVEDGIEWAQNPPYSPHFGGLWEAGIKSLKYHLHRVVGNAVLTYEEMGTFVSQVMAVLNSRPLTPMSSDPSDLSALTPAHFLTGDSILALPEPDYTEEKFTHLSRWQITQRMLQVFWKRWSSEYLTRLQSRPKWWIQYNNIKINDLVLLKEDNLPPLKWKLGRIVQVHPGMDNLVRTVTIRTKDGETKRAITKIAPLPYDE